MYCHVCLLLSKIKKKQPTVQFLVSLDDYYKHIYPIGKGK